MLNSIKNILLYGEAKLYQKHPDIRQEKFFLSLLKECMNKNLISSEFLKLEINKGHIRPDIFRALKTVNSSAQSVLEIS